MARTPSSSATQRIETIRESGREVVVAGSFSDRGAFCGLARGWSRGVGLGVAMVVMAVMADMAVVVVRGEVPGHRPGYGSGS